MIRVLVVLFWLSLLIGTLLAHSLVANWAVTLAGLYVLARWWRSRAAMSRAARTAARGIAPSAGANQSSGSNPAPSVHARPRWTADRVHTANQRWH